MRRVVVCCAWAALAVLATAGPALADNCGTLTDCLPSAKGLLIALAAVLIIAGVVAIGFGGAALLAAAFGGGGLALAGGGVISAAGAISVSAAAEITAAGAIATTTGVMMASAADGTGGPAGPSQGGPGGGQGVGPKPPAQPPTVSDTRLGNIVRDLFKGTRNPNRIGDGTTMDAIRNELSTGQATSGKMHLQKGREYAAALRNWLSRNPNASTSDRTVAQQLLEQLQNALAGNP
jgi:hypothetical protein